MDKREHLVRTLIQRSGLERFVTDGSITNSDIDGICSLYDAMLSNEILSFLDNPPKNADEILDARRSIAPIEKRLRTSPYRTGGLAYLLLADQMIMVYLKHEKELSILLPEQLLNFDRLVKTAYGCLGSSLSYLAEKIEDPEFLLEILEKANYCFKKAEERGDISNENYQKSATGIYNLLKAKNKIDGSIDTQLLEEFLEESKGFARTFKMRARAPPKSSPRYSHKKRRKLELKLHAYEHLFTDMAELLTYCDQEKVRPYRTRLQQFYNTEVRALHERLSGNLKDFKTLTF